MPPQFQFNTTTVVMNNPGLRVKDKSNVCDKKERKEYFAKLEEYKTSEVVLPAVWARRSINHPAHFSPLENCVMKLPKVDLYLHREATEYYPFCKHLFDVATTDQKCDWIHCVDYCCLKDETYIYNFPCGCNNQDLLNIDNLRRAYKVPMSTWHPTSAVVLPPISTEEGMKQYKDIGWFEVPRCQVFREASPTKRGKKRKALSLTDHKSYRKLLRSRRATTAKYSSKLLGEDSDSDGWGVSS